MGADRGRYRRLAGEMAVIVLSILLALAADAAWDLRGELQRERAYLNALEIEFEAARAELAEDEANRSLRLTYLDSLQSNFGRSRSDAGVVSRWVTYAAAIVFFLPPTAVYNDLLSSGSLGLIRSDSLRLALLGYDQEVSKLRLMEEREQVFVENEYRHYILSEFVLDTASATPEASNRLLADRRFQNLVWSRRNRLEVTQRFSAEVATMIDRVLLLLRSELEG